LYYGALLSLKFGLQIYYNIAKNRKRVFGPGTNIVIKNKTPDQNTHISMINNSATCKEIKKALPNFKWVILDDYLCDVTGFFHPVGDYLLAPI